MNPSFLLRFALLILCLFAALAVQAQFRVLPLTQTPPNQVRATNQSARVQAVTLPFYEDFSTYYGQPDPNLWINGGTVVNNTYDDLPPSKGFATFDGLRFNGVPYVNNPNVTSGPTDTLTSQPINLGGLTPASNVLMSFWWSAQSFGETPDRNDSLVLQFKDRTGNWITRWSDTAVNRDQRLARENFRDTLLQVNDARFLHEAFQFRFVAYGRPSGMFDVWNLDYVIIDRNPAYNPRSLRDVAVTRQPKSVLKRYSAMPLEQFQASPTTEMGNTDSTTVYNQENNFNFFSYSHTVNNLNTGQELARFVFQGTTIQIDDRSRNDIGVAVPNTLTVSGAAPVTLRTQFRITTDPVTVIPGVDLSRNDTIGRTTVLADYYAYDDGTAEYGAGIRQRQGSVAVRYVLNKPDTLTAVQLLLVHAGDRDLAGQTFVVNVWKRLDGRRESVLYQRAYAINYPTQLNRFNTYLLLAPTDSTTRPLAVSDTIYVGWTQSTTDLLAVGYDRNTDSRGQQFYNISGGGQWQPNTEPEPGSLMVRPVFGQGIVTSTEPVLPITGLPGFRVFPNPANDRLFWNTEGVSRVSIRNLLGQTLKTMALAPSAPGEISTADLPAGVYLFYFQIGSRQVLRKVAVVR